MASTSSSSSTLVRNASSEGLRTLYRTLLCQARLLATTLDDPIIYSSHRYLARQNLSPLLPPRSSFDCSPTTAVRRIARAQTHRRHLADANFGWTHAVHRALSLAYARSGKLRRDALSDLSPQCSTAPSEQRYPKSLRRKQVAPVLTALLTNAASMDGAVVKSERHLTGRAPPPYLAAEEDALVKLYGKAMGRRRVENAARRFRRDYMRKIKLPVDVVVGNHGGELFDWIENKARPVRERRVNPSLAMDTARRGKVQHVQHVQAKEDIERYRSKMHSSAHRKASLRRQGWSSHPRDWTRSRAQRRLYANMLKHSPLLVLTPSSSAAQIQTPEKVNKDPLTIRAKLRQANQLVASMSVARNKVSIGRSRYAVTHTKGDVLCAPIARDGSGRETDARDEWDSSELGFLRDQGWF